MRARWPGGRARLTAAVATLVVLAGCANTKQNVLDPQGQVARQEDRLWNIVFPIAAFFFFLVMILTIFIAWRFRERDVDAAPKQLHGNTILEAGWTAIPAAILLVVGVLTVTTVIDINRKATGPDTMAVTVIGHQWWWEYKYPAQKVTTANELHIPVGTKVNVRLESADVIHSWWPPKLAGKVDVIPGRVNHMVIEADKPGTYYGQCTEYCGLSHANMRLRVVAMEKAAFQTWAGEQAGPGAKPADGTTAAAGAALFRAKGCSGCHTVQGYSVGAVGPNLTHFASRQTFAGAIFDRNNENLRRWLLDPPKEKPMKPDKGLGMPNLHLTDDEITKLIAYLDTLK
ncbi:MAG: cytochrome c oxidase subunit [Actinomycetota bacterium]|nr:cytochrome c oxidase subunit [Actinomycetota bacterium]